MSITGWMFLPVTIEKPMPRFRVVTDTFRTRQVTPISTGMVDLTVGTQELTVSVVTKLFTN